MTTSDLLFVFTTMLRPVLDFAVPTYHPLLSIGQSRNIEALQKKALRVVYGPNLRYEEALAIANLTTLEDRREALTKSFAVAAEKNPRYQDGWFPRKPDQAYPIRKPRPFIETRSSTERMKKPDQLHEKTVKRCLSASIKLIPRPHRSYFALK